MPQIVILQLHVGANYVMITSQSYTLRGVKGLTFVNSGH